mmetsp:Transcript_18250/g.54087  ORF Transcript_18250/g.54087 Transcript_18250/m.54087 type:complete len:179 (+) Transcript_18250:64-600(+)|eukprot:CAMPEP_0206286294 /NCGR_PEP_ID=MMETSP0106_2-20121207/528_1 /ASSEMBLY_ACC=CAM_ASM_000206 /TAXON_ID=81532 /ORGANISM="Acanthoeca-like sp., Strain 10tr" /LENGTH=178 /DNA_ID=CAMNT_0053716815 /DNA_START=59 /DNA_END=595 /DNA_ORIENTATION=+
MPNESHSASGPSPDVAAAVRADDHAQLSYPDSDTDPPTANIDAVDYLGTQPGRPLYYAPSTPAEGTDFDDSVVDAGQMVDSGGTGCAADIKGKESLAERGCTLIVPVSMSSAGFAMAMVGLEEELLLVQIGGYTLIGASCLFGCLFRHIHMRTRTGGSEQLDPHCVAATETTPCLQTV